MYINLTSLVWSFSKVDHLVKLRRGLFACILVFSLSTPAVGQFRMSNTQVSAIEGSVSSDVTRADTNTTGPNIADPIPDNSSTVGVQGGRYGLGFASSWPAYGISGTVQVSEKLTGEAVLGFFGAVSNFGGRIWYRFNRNEKYDIYGFGGVSVYRYKGFNSILLGSSRVNESVVGLGVGAGIEAGLPQLIDDEDFPPIFLNAELGLALASFQHYGGFSTLSLGFGIHYRFGSKS